MAACEHLEQESPETPDISFVAVLLSVDQLWSHSERCASERVCQRRARTHRPCKSHISELELEVRYVFSLHSWFEVDQDIVKLDISVHNLVMT